MAINKASIIMVEGNQLPDATTMASLAIFLSTAGVTQMPKMQGPKARVITTKAMATRTMVLALLGVMGRSMVGPMPWMPMRHRGMQLISLKAINQAHI